jgi:hypothetical protein
MCLVTQIAARIQIWCLIVHTESVHKSTQILCLGIIHLSLKNMDYAKGKQPNVFLKDNTFCTVCNTDPLLI